MLIAVILLSCAVAMLAVLVLRLLLQFSAWADWLENTPPDSNTRLSVSVRLYPVVRAARAINGRLDQTRQQTLDTRKAGQELQNTMAALSHDIRTPLAAACGHLELLRTESDPDARARRLDTVEQRLHDLGSLLDEMFLYTRLNAGERMPMDLRPVVLWPALCEVLAALYPQLEAAGLEPRLEFTNKSAAVLADPDALDRVLRNLVTNAIQHAAGGLIITQTADGLVLENQVADPSAIDPAHLFDRFWRADNARRSGRGGAGLGLAIVRQLTEAMNGQVYAELEGDTLRIRLRLPPAAR